MKAIVERYSDIFEGYGCIAGEVSLEINNNIKPILQKSRRIPVALRKDLKNELERLVKLNIITKEREHTDWISNILLVKKAKAFRIYLNSIPLNQALKKPNYQFVTLEEILSELENVKVFSMLIKLDENSSKLTTF